MQKTECLKRTAVLSSQVRLDEPQEGSVEGTSDRETRRVNGSKSQLKSVRFGGRKTGTVPIDLIEVPSRLLTREVEEERDKARRAYGRDSTLRICQKAQRRVSNSRCVKERERRARVCVTLHRRAKRETSNTNPFWL